MKARAAAGSKFARNIRELPRSERHKPEQRAAVSARARVEQAQYVYDREVEAFNERRARMEAAGKELSDATAALEKAEAALPPATTT